MPRSRAHLLIIQRRRPDASPSLLELHNDEDILPVARQTNLPLPGIFLNGKVTISNMSNTGISSELLKCFDSL